MLHLLECYFTPLPLMCPVREQQHGSLTCHIVACHCLMIRECWRHSAASGVINCCRGAAILPQICLGLWPRLSQADVFSPTLIWSHFTPYLPFFHLNGLTLCPLLRSPKWIHAFIHCIQSQKRLRHTFVHNALSSCFSWSSQPQLCHVHKCLFFKIFPIFWWCWDHVRLNVQSVFIKFRLDLLCLIMNISVLGFIIFEPASRRC